MNNIKPIGILDSGIGGFSVYRSVREILPAENIIYIADKKYLPYGEKTSLVIRERADLLVSFLKKEGVKIIIVACNTASVSALEYVREKHSDINIIGTVPAIKPCAEKTRNGNIGVLCTPKTARSAYQKELIKEFASNKNVYIQPCTGLVEAIEEGRVDKFEFAKVLNSLKQNNVDTIALGCTHFPLAQKEIIEALADDSILILDNGKAISKHTKNILATDNALNKNTTEGKSVFYTTADKEKFDIMINKYLDISAKSQFVNI